MNPEKQRLLERRKKLASKPHIDMTPKDMLDYERIVKRLNEIEVYEIHEQLKKE